MICGHRQIQSVSAANVKRESYTTMTQERQKQRDYHREPHQAAYHLFKEQLSCMQEEMLSIQTCQRLQGKM